MDDEIMDDPSPPPTESNGRDPATGRFLRGNAFGEGNPNAQRTAELRAAVAAAVGPDDLREIVEKLVQRAKQGDIAAAKEVLDRSVGRPHQSIEAKGISFPS